MTVDSSREVTKVRWPMQPPRLGDSLQTFLIACALALIAVASGSAATRPSTPWTPKAMTMAVKAVGYPRPHAKRVTCRGLGVADSAGRFSGFRCVAIYRRRPTRRVFYMAATLGGWLCAGPRLATCKTLRHGFVATDMAPYGVAAEASVSASGYAENKYGVTSTERSASCTPAGTLSWSCPFTAPAATITVTYRPVKGGWLVSASR